MSTLRFALAALVLVGSTAPGLAAPPDAHFEKKVRPVLIERCVTCHGPEKQKGGLRVDSRTALLAGGARGAALVPGKPDEGLLLRTLAHDGELKMPPKAKLPAAEIAAIKEWVQVGAPWPDSGALTVAPKTTERIFTPEEKAFWAFQPVRRAAAPEIRDPKSEIRNDIDRFLLAKLNGTGLSFAPPADKRVLLRRVTFDLTGLPPTPEEVDSFLKDSAPDAYEKVVTRLLASPAYGEKWGRRWLDVARYADSNGMDENLAYVNAWRYRDWVIKSFNADKPYEQFVRDQIAGDLVPGGTAAERADRTTATGFLVIGPKMLAEDDPAKMRMDIIDEQLDALGQAFMGLTLGCARCHDHKFDPITVSDYYGLAGIFYSTKTMRNHTVVAAWNERPIGTASSVVALAAHEKAVAAARAEVSAAEARARATTRARLTEEKKHVAEYATAAVEVYRRRGALKLVAPDPGKNPPAGAVLVESEAFARGNVLKLTDGYGAGIGVVINAGPLPNYAEYDLDVPKEGAYQIAVRYAAADRRPVRILVNGRLVAGEACGTKTGSWNPDTQTWVAEAVVVLPTGKAVVRFERNGPVPHLDKFALLPMTAEQVAAAPLPVERAAADRKLLTSLLREWADVIAKREGKPPTGADLDALIAADDGPFRDSPELDADTQGAHADELKRLREKLAATEKAKPPVDEVMAVEDAKGENLRVHLRGNHTTLGADAPRRFPQIMAGGAPLPLGADRSGRRELAEWLTRPDHPLTARVMVNRIWAGHFGAGLVRSTDNFGRLGDRPTHPELLDWLAAEFVGAKWSVKHMHRLIVTSAAYRMSSQAEPAALQKDPDNKLLSHFTRRRLDAEEVRDGMLAVSGLLDRKVGGTLLKATPRQYVTGTGNRNYEGYAHTRRSVYLPVVRSAVYDVFQTLDFPDPSVPNGQRTATTIPTQSLFMLNSALADQAAEAFAKAVLAVRSTDAGRVHEAYRRVYGRPPTDREEARVLAYLQKSEEASGPAAEGSQLRVWRGLCRVLLASNEFVFVE
ncbi:secreted protein containing duf1549 : Uncharacterized protein OS=Pirellula staleyi (strain ATCC 27377 / DSM 6068 / ICPB 4128) GN=Psta_3103 PE=4 SV=1: PSCyt1: PSCyt2: PSD1 [Gemmata massiliana]|uniref:Cytochrome c domain-containing protein n=1 Tax=Gemmata massiliana TaxID=1210884 RepID=A0A6P2D214_9BACT|nr:DUF1553 domain-containing protein [Gemmata massiliana]VTR95169.1 secreted protein containing duf1549 : Uncharacterized protein OS=Pirellula staleyi (strain ATCC 27377 / DSM 6068 / ICPB 4128) GN=Psta_3103 PE=4 SV=1: PSCyt1: PSCyt2: PSD1 [Gemmata massiliana]